MTDKTATYQKLVARRKACRACESLGLTNPSACAGGQFDTHHIGPWTTWYGNLDADIIIIGQDWGGQDYFLKNHGADTDDNPTNSNLQTLLASVGYPIALQHQPQVSIKLFFTNAVLCLKSGGLTGPVKAACFRECGSEFLKPQIELVQPKVVVTLGFGAYKAVMRVYGLRPLPSMREAVKRLKYWGPRIWFRSTIVASSGQCRGAYPSRFWTGNGSQLLWRKGPL